MCDGVETLSKRYPDLALLFMTSAIPTQSHAEQFFFKSVAVDVMYVYGIHESAYLSLKSWLNAEPKRQLVFLEDHLPRLKQFISTQAAEECLLHPHVHLVGLFSQQSFKEHLENVVLQFPTENIAVTSLFSNQRKRRFRLISDILYRFSTLMHVFFTELLQYPKLLSNILPNAGAWTTSFFAHELRGVFRGIPAVICGAGPSLDDAGPTLAKITQHALLFACGSAIPALGSKKIMPHLGVAVDPNEQEFARFCASSCFDMPLLYATRLHSDVFSTLCGPKGYMRTATGGPCERILEEEMGISGVPLGPELGMEAFSVTTLAMALAVEMGCSPIYFCGVDLSYVQRKCYASGVVRDAGWKQSDKIDAIRCKDIHGNWVYTHRKWIMESNCISAFASAHPEVSFINGSMKGLGFRGIPNESLEGLFRFPMCDFHALVHAEIQTLPRRSLSKEQILHALLRINEDLRHMEYCARQLRTEYARPSPSFGRIALLEHDFLEANEKVALFSSLDAVLSRLSARERWVTWCTLCQESLRSFSQAIKKMNRI